MIELNITSNVKELIAYFNRLPSVMRRKRNTNLQTIGKFIKRESQKNAPYKTGQLSRNIDYKVVGDEVYIFVGGSAEDYAWFAHYGHYKRGRGTILKGGRAGRLYIQRAIEDNKEKVAKILEDIY